MSALARARQGGAVSVLTPTASILRLHWGTQYTAHCITAPHTMCAVTRDQCSHCSEQCTGSMVAPPTLVTGATPAGAVVWYNVVWTECHQTAYSALLCLMTHHPFDTVQYSTVQYSIVQYSTVQ